VQACPYLRRGRPRRERLAVAKIDKHSAPRDWCHVCGTSTDTLADIWFPSRAAPPRAPNAEGADEKQHARGYGEPDTEYIRICAHCALTIGAVAAGDQAGPVIVRQRGRTARRKSAKRSVAGDPGDW
jgi:hypothetical protein